MPGKTELSHAKLTSAPGMNIPAGAQNITIINGASNGISAVYGNGPFQIWFVYEGGPAAVFNYQIDNGPMQPMTPNIYPNLSAQQKITFQWQVNAGQLIKLVWIFLSGC
jgi:hypothetical protein